ncbi:MAG: divalent-cation tolerance protein CutA [Candidatus Aenigmatarchaeota archaeon]
MGCVIFLTCPKERIAEKVAKDLLKKKLIACASVIPKIKSFYWWEGKIERNSEVLVMMKTEEKLFPLIEKEILKIHPYKIPEIICFRIEKGFEKYLKWIKEVVRK